MHQISAQRAAEFAAFRDHKAYVQLRVDPFYVRVQERCPDVANVIAPIIGEMLTRKEALCHGDYTPKNLLIHQTRRGQEAGFTLVDYETAHVGDPTMDLGLFLAHLTLKAVRAPEHGVSLIALMRAFWHAYGEQVSFGPLPELEARGARHLGVCLLARVDGTSPVDYLEERGRNAVRKLARRILLDGVHELEAFWNHLRGVTCPT
jgi:5-methylthioribose kinase